jgi:2-amino-4-hydroxy-6-hydroxymethyldihydropteridine diphosphokinase
MSEVARVNAFIGIGSNIDEPQMQVALALHELKELPDTRLVRCSSLYETDPVGFVDQSRFINAVAMIDTSLAPRALLDCLLDIEQRHGRVRMMKNGPRSLDLDILLYGNLRVHEDGLTIPHPRMQERGFVIEPLLEVDPDCDIPGLGRAAQFLPQVQNQGVRKLEYQQP